MKAATHASLGGVGGTLQPRRHFRLNGPMVEKQMNLCVDVLPSGLFHFLLPALERNTGPPEEDEDVPEPQPCKHNGASQGVRLKRALA